jgi:hypothetical protein
MNVRACSRNEPEIDVLADKLAARFLARYITAAR